MALRLLDLFCGAGGASVGYARAGFEVVGVDIEPHAEYPFPFRLADALEVLEDTVFLSGFDVVHASPPCQAHTTMSNRWRGSGGVADSHAALIAPVRDRLRAWGGLYVIENVPGARAELVSPMVLCGSAFGLGVQRHRLFESSAFLMSPGCFHGLQRSPIGVYGCRADGRRLWTRADGSHQRAAASLEEAQGALAIDWMSEYRDLAESIPPAYTEWVGRQVADAVAALRSLKDQPNG